MPAVAANVRVTSGHCALTTLQAENVPEQLPARTYNWRKRLGLQRRRDRLGQRRRLGLQRGQVLAGGLDARRIGGQADEKTKQASRIAALAGALVGAGGVEHGVGAVRAGVGLHEEFGGVVEVAGTKAFGGALRRGFGLGGHGGSSGRGQGQEDRRGAKGAGGESSECAGS